MTKMLKDVEGGEVRRPYNIKEKKEKDAAYRSLIRAELAADYSAKELASDLKTNTRYLSAVINSRFGMNYSCLVNEYRIREAAHLLVDRRYLDKNVEEISTMVGFANRQSFYAAFYRIKGETPRNYRRRHLEKTNK